MATMGSVKVSVETIAENLIQEIGLDGTEYYVQPLSMSENLTKLAHKIDFSKDESDEKGKPTSEGDKEAEEEKAVAKFQPSLWPWDSVRNKLKLAHTEMSVLLDVLNIAKEKRYMLLDAVQQEAPEQKPTVLLLAKKKALGEAANILIEGAERIRKSNMEKSLKRSEPDFHVELRKLRQNWRLKKVGNTILGDLSYKSSGSRFWQGGTFEVIKTEEDKPQIDVLMSPTQMAPKTALQVMVPSQLEGVAYIQVCLKRAADSLDMMSAHLSLPTQANAAIPEDAHWQRKLEAAQNVIFCKELFSQLARETVQIKSGIPVIIVGNQIIVTIFPGVQLSIRLCHYTGKDKRQPHTQQRMVHNQVLEHTLHQLLRRVHYDNTNHPMPHPVTATLGVSKRRRVAGPQAYSKQDLLDMLDSDTLLSQIIKQAKHMVLRMRVANLLDQVAKVNDPQIAVHWNSLSSPEEASCRINITSLGYESVRTSLSVSVLIDSIKAVCRDGRVLNLSYEQSELRDLILSQLAQHQIAVTQSLCKMLGWQLLSNSNYLGVGDMEPLGSSSSVMMASPTGHRVIAVKSCAVTGVHVSVQRCPRRPENTQSKSVVTDPKWEKLGGEFQEVNLQKMEGKNFVSKIETLMASLA